jgi:rhamnulose-1-phosphate aldolase
MQSNQARPDFDSLIRSIGAAGRRLSELDACEGGAGNMSVYLRLSTIPANRFPTEEALTLPDPIPEFSGSTFLVTGSGCRLRDIEQDPEANLACVVVDPGGMTARCFSSIHRQFRHPTSEFNSHLAVHREVAKQTGTAFNAVVHAQPRKITFLSHHPNYRTEAALVARLYRWQPETIVNLPEGVGLVAFAVPGSPELMQNTIAAMRTHRIVIWAKHGVMARSEKSVMHAIDLIEYAETAASYEYMDLATGQKTTGLTRDELLAICKLWNVPQRIL